MLQIWLLVHPTSMLRIFLLVRPTLMLRIFLLVRPTLMLRTFLLVRPTLMLRTFLLVRPIRRHVLCQLCGTIRTNGLGIVALSFLNLRIATASPRLYD
jgi:hypothetical protein